MGRHSVKALHLIAGLAVLVLIGALVWTWSFLTSTHARNGQWLIAVETAASQGMAGDADDEGPIDPDTLIARLQTAGLVRIDTTRFTIETPDCTAREREEKEAAEGLIRRFCGVPFQSVRASINTWNAARSLIAIRNRSAMRPGAAGSSLEDARDNPWRPRVNLAPPNETPRFRPADRARIPVPPPEQFGFVACFLAPGETSTPWRMVGRSSVDFFADATAQEAMQDPVRIQVLAGPNDPPVLYADGEARAFRPLCTGGGDGEPLGVGRTCTNAERACGEMEIWETRFAPPADGELRVRAFGATNIPLRLRPFIGAAALDFESRRPRGRPDLVEPIGERLQIECWLESPACALLPGDRPSAQLLSAATLTLPLPNGARAVFPTGSLVDPELADTYGIEAVTGVSLADAASFALTVGGRLEDERTLTIDAEYQAAAHRVLDCVMADAPTRCLDQAAVRDRVRPFFHPSIESRDLRSAAFLIVEASGPNAGAIRAASAWPRPNPAIATWDLQAIRAWDPQDRAFNPSTWTVRGRMQTPGSTFKVITALAAARGVADPATPPSVASEIETAMLGRVGEADAFGLSCSDTTLLVPRPLDEDGETLTSIGSRRGALCANHASPQHCANADGSQSGVCRALHTSNNIWFGALALATELKVADVSVDEISAQCSRQRSTGETASPHLAGLLEAVDWDPVFDLRTGAPSPTARGGYAFAQSVMAESASQVEDPASDRSLFACLQIAQNGFGQAAQATPLALTTLMAGLARADLAAPSPFLIDGADPTPARDIAGPIRQDERAGRILGEIRRGMAAVGATSPALTDIDRNRFWAKTGTATSVEREGGTGDIETAWMVGWWRPNAAAEMLSPTSAVPAGETAYAFACMVAGTASDEDAIGGGGSVCGPIVNAVLRQVNGDD